MDFESMRGSHELDDIDARIDAYALFNRMKNANAGWEECIDLLISGKEIPATRNFICYNVIYEFIKERYAYSNEEQQQTMRNFISRWINLACTHSNSKSKVDKNKMAQLISLVVVVDYPNRWPTFFKDLMQTLTLGPHAVDLYILILRAINSEIADRELNRTQKELERFTEIKDAMRDDCITELVDSWFQILSTYASHDRNILLLCLDVIGGYVSWIDINLIANERFVSHFVNFLTRPEVRMEACECIEKIIEKGMDPLAKIELVQSFSAVLDQAGVLKINERDYDAEEYFQYAANLINGMGTALLTSWTRLRKARDAKGCAIAAAAIHSKVGLLLKFLDYKAIEVSRNVIDFAREYLQFLKHQAAEGLYGAQEVANVEAMLYIIINRYKYEPSLNIARQMQLLSYGKPSFPKPQLNFYENQREIMFEESRKSLKVLFDNLALLDTPFVFTKTKEVIIGSLHQWRILPFQDVEVAITFLYLLGEALSPSHGNHFSGESERKADMMEMLQLLVTCGVNSHGNPAVTLQFFETIVRFEKFFVQEPQHIGEILVAFLDTRGLRNRSPHIRSRTSFLFSRFIKCLKNHVHGYTEDILQQLQDLLVLAPPVNGAPAGLLSPDDQLYLYETAAILIINSHFNTEKKHMLLSKLLTPVATYFDELLQKIVLEENAQQQNAIAKSMNHAISVTSRTSKGFSNHQTMQSCGCVEVYSEALRIFIGALSLPIEQPILQSAVRQYLHRMVVCLEASVLPFIPSATEQLLKSSDPRSIQEFIPLINQIITKFKKDIVPFLHQIFLPFVNSIFSTLAAPIDEADEHAKGEKQLLQRSYFNFISAIMNNNITEVIQALDMQSMKNVFLTVIQGAVEFPDPVAQRTCFSILKKMVELWGGPDGIAGFVEFIYESIVPSCFVAPLKSTFDLNDAQTSLALTESALCLKMVLNKRGDEFVLYLQNQYLPTLNVSPEQIQEYCQALKSDTKAFKNYHKIFFQNART